MHNQEMHFNISDVCYSKFSHQHVLDGLDVHKSVHRDTTMKITNKMHYID